MSAAMSDNNDQLISLLRRSSVLLCLGAGGVGKTTTAAALGVLAARIGLKVCVLTIDPARRLADALGSSEAAHVPVLVKHDSAGELWFTMLDAKAAFDDVVRNEATDDDQATEILSNRVYRNVSSVLGGTQEYVATERLYQLHSSGAYDLVIVDTPPSRDALAFLDASSRLLRLLDNTLFKVLTAPARGGMKIISFAAQQFLRTMSRVVGARVVGDALAFFNAFEGMEAGFRQRASAVRALILDEQTALVLVTTPVHESLHEATWLREQLRSTGHECNAVIVNRAHEIVEMGVIPNVPPGTLLARQVDRVRELAEIARREHLDVQASFASDLVVTVPAFAGDVHDLDGLDQVATALAGGKTH